MKASFALGTRLLEVQDISAGGDWSLVRAVISASDYEGMYSPLDIQVGDVHFLGTSASVTGTVSAYTVTTVVYATYAAAQLEFSFDTANSHTAPDLTFVLGEQGFLTRRSINLGLSAIPSYTVQNIPERLGPFIQNFDTYRILDNFSSGGGSSADAINAIVLATHTRISVSYNSTSNRLAFTADPTNLSLVLNSNSIQVNSSTGSSATIPEATQSLAGLISSTSKIKLDAVPTPASIATLSSTQQTSISAGSSSLTVSYSGVVGAGTSSTITLLDYGHATGSGWLLSVSPLVGNTVEIYYSLNGTVFILYDTLSSEYAVYEGTPGDGIIALRITHTAGSDACGFNLK